MTVSVYVLVGAGLGLALLAAALIPAPTRPAEDGAGIGLGLLTAGCITAFVMGIVALLGLPVATAWLGVAAWLIVMPCIWLARAPRPLEDPWGHETEEDDDDDGGSRSPSGPVAPTASDEEQAGAQAPATAPGRVTWTPAPQPVAVMATAARARQLLAAEEAQRLDAAREVERLVAAREVERQLAAASVSLPEGPAAPAPEPAGPLHTPQWPRLQPPPRLRADHRSIVHPFAALADAHPRRHALAAQRRAQRAALRG